MAGHSKWANIKHKKERADAKKGKLFSRIAKEIISAVKQGGSDPKANAKLKLALDKAKAANVPLENIERNIKKASSQDQADYVEITYELYGYEGVGIIAEVMTDNKNRIASEMRIATNKRGGSIAAPGSVLYNFEKRGVIRLSKEGVDENALFEAVIEGGADDLQANDEGFIVFTGVESLNGVKEALERAHYSLEEVEIREVPKTLIACSDEAKEKNRALMEWIENIDDVDALYHNMKD